MGKMFFSLAEGLALCRSCHTTDPDPDYKEKDAEIGTVCADCDLTFDGVNWK